MKTRTLPHSVEAEQGVLGSMLISPREIIAECVEKISADYFHVPAHQTIYEVLVELWNTGEGIDLITFTQALRDRNLLDAVGGGGFVTSLFTFVPTAANITYYLEIVREKYILRQIIAFSTESVRRAYNEQDEVTVLVDLLKQNFYALGLDGFKGKRGIHELVSDVLNNLSDREKVLGVSTGFAALDSLVGGLAPKAKVVIGGATSGGKSAFAQCLINSLAVDRKVPTALFTYEMSAEEAVMRLVQIRSGVSTRAVADGTADMMEMDRYNRAATEIAAAPLFIIDEQLDIAGIKAVCTKLAPRVAVIDYLQIIPEKWRANEGTTERLDRMSSGTKQIAQQLGITVVELTQLTVNDKTGKITTRYSAGITNDANQLWILEGEDDETKETIQKFLTVAKQRDGARSQVAFDFARKITRFRERNKN